MLLLKIFFLFQISYADIIPTGINDSDSDLIANSLSTSYSGALAKPSYALGTGAALSLSTSYLNVSDLSKASSSNISKSVLINQISISKGLYYNFDLGLSSVLPFESNKSIAGFGGYVNWLKKYNGFSIKPSLYLYSLNIDNVFNTFSAGFSISAFKKVSFLSLGAHLAMESSETDILAMKNGENIFISGEKKNDERLYSSAGLSLALEMEKFDIILQPIYNFETDLVINFKLNINI